MGQVLLSKTTIEDMSVFNKTDSLLWIEPQIVSIWLMWNESKRHSMVNETCRIVFKFEKRKKSDGFAKFKKLDS